MINLVKDMEPSSYKQASNFNAWVEVMNEEIAALHECKTWDIVLQPPDKNVTYKTSDILLLLLVIILFTYTDGDWAGDPDQRRYISGYCIFIGQFCFLE